MKTAQVAFVIFALLLCTRLTQSANVLAIFSYTFHTPYLVVIPYIKALIGKGHSVTLISSVSLLPDIEGVRHLRIANIDVLIEYLKNFDFDVDLLTDKWKIGAFAAKIHSEITNKILSDERVQALLKDKSENFDLILMEPTHSDALMGFAEHFNASLVGLSAIGCSWLVDYQAGNSAPSVYRPISPMGYALGDGPLERWHNWIHIVEEFLIDQLIFVPLQLELFHRYFPYQTESFYERRRNFSLILINQHFSLGRVRSNAPNVIEVAGMHMAEPMTALEPELLDFLNGAEHGVIYFSMGVEIFNKYLPERMEQKMLQTFSQLPQRVVWKHEMETMPNRSDNIYLSQMASQRQLLEHPNMKLFITHGGLLSLIEAVYSGVPMLGIPVYFDQFDNVDRMQQAGVARSVDINALTVEQLTHIIKELLQNPSYTLKAKELSARFRDQPTSPLERAVWWTEYVLRHRGAPHMRMAEQEVAFVPYYRIQFFLILYGRIAFTGFMLIIVCFTVFNCVFKEFHRFFNTT